MIIGFKCVKDQSLMSFDDCLDCSLTYENPCQFSYPILKGIYENIQNRDYLSVTSIIGCLRNTYLEMTHEIYVSPESLYWLFRGNIAHLVIDDYQPPDAISEKTFEREFEGVTLRGTPDNIIILPEQKKIIDYKTTARIPFFNNPYSNHKLQLNLYRWLIAPEYRIDKLEVQYLDMKNVKKLEAKLMSFEEVEDYLFQRLLPLKDAIDSGNCPPKPPADSKDRWQCNGYCNVADLCEAYWKEEIREEAINELRNDDEIEGSIPF